MYAIIWEYQVRAAQLLEFEKMYESNCIWAELFRRASGYISTELMHNVKHPPRYITIDRWDSSESYEIFRSQFRKEYETLDAQCEGLTEQETLLGKWESVINQTR